MMSANPQGKGLVPVLEHWRDAQPSVVHSRTPREVLRDYLVTALVVSAEFRFKPRTGVQYFIYLADGAWQLSLVSPEEWRGRAPGPCLGRCMLQPDMTWQLTPSEDIAEHPALLEGIEAFHQGFVAWLDRDGTLEDHLPFHVRRLPYYRRLLAAGMAGSLQRSLSRSGLEHRQSREWLAVKELPRLNA
jgi:hypothetical protein